MSKEIFEKLRPVDSLAARVTSPGVHYVPDKKHGSPVFYAPPKTRQATATERLIPGYQDLVGITRGRLTTIGILDAKGIKWVMRCNCGSYVIRTSKAIKNDKNVADCCEDCRHILYQKRTSLWRRTGKDVHVEKFI